MAALSALIAPRVPAFTCKISKYARVTPLRFTRAASTCVSSAARLIYANTVASKLSKIPLAASSCALRTSNAVRYPLISVVSTFASVAPSAVHSAACIASKPACCSAVIAAYNAGAPPWLRLTRAAKNSPRFSFATVCSSPKAALKVSKNALSTFSKRAPCAA